MAKFPSRRSQISQIYWDLGYGVESVATYLATITNKNVMVQLFIKASNRINKYFGTCARAFASARIRTVIRIYGVGGGMAALMDVPCPGVDFSGMLAR